MHKDRYNGEECIRVDYADSQALANRKHRCMISLIYSAGLRRSELLNLTPQDIMSERMLIRIMGKGKKCRYSLLSEKVLCELREYFKEYRPKKWLFEGDTPGEKYSASALVKVLKEAADRAEIGRASCRERV